MKFKSTIAMILVLSAISLYYFYVDIPQEKKQKEEEERSKKIILFEKNQIRSVSLEKINQTLEIKMEKDTWFLEKPLSANADQEAANALLTVLQNARFTKVIEKEPSDLSAFGLQKPHLTISLSLNNETNFKLLIGDKAPIGSFTYVKRQDETRILLCPTALGDLDKSVYELRDKTILKVSPDSINSFEIFGEENFVSLSQKGKTWTIEGESITGPADASKISTIISTLKQAQIKSFVNENPSDLAIYGLNRPFLKVKLKQKDGIQTLMIGSLTSKGNHYAKMDNATNVFTIEKTLVDLLSSKPLDYLTKVLAKFDQAKVRSFDIETSDHKISVVLDKIDKEKWRIKKPLETAADLGTVNSLLFDLKATRISQYIKAAALNLKPFGLTPAQKSFRISMLDGTSLIFHIGSVTKDGKKFFARREGDKSVFLLEQTDVEKIFRSLHDLRDKKLLSFDDNDIARILLIWPDKKFELIKKGETWDLIQPKQLEKVKNFVVQDILWTMDHLEFIAIAKSVKNFTLESPKLVIRMFDQTGVELNNLTIAEPIGEADYLYAKKKSEATIYEIRKRFLEQIPSTLDKFKT